MRSKFFILITIGVFLIGQWGCVVGPTVYSKPEPLLEKYREQLGTIGVVTGLDVPVIKIDPLPPPPVPPYTTPGVLARMGQGASDGAEKTGGWMWNICKEVATARTGGSAGVGYIILGAGLVVWCVLSVPVGILGGIGGFFYGALPSDDPFANFAYPAADEANLRYTVANYPIQENLQSFFLKEARARTSHTFVVVPEEGSQPSEGLVEQCVDTVLELSVQRIWWKLVGDRELELNPPMVLALVVRSRLVRGTENTVWYDQTFIHETKKRLYKEWPYYYRFRTDIEKALQSLAEQLVSELFFKKPNEPTMSLNRVGLCCFRGWARNTTASLEVPMT